MSYKLWSLTDGFTLMHMYVTLLFRSMLTKKKKDIHLQEENWEGSRRNVNWRGVHGWI